MACSFEGLLLESVIGGLSPKKIPRRGKTCEALGGFPSFE